MKKVFLYSEKKREIAAIVAAVTIAVVWTVYKREKNIASVHESSLQTGQSVPVEVKIEKVYPSGRGWRRFTIMRVSYSCKGERYTGTIQTSGYTEGQYKRNDIITRYIDPSCPEILIEKKTSGR
jgi:hypothetical protein